MIYNVFVNAGYIENVTSANVEGRGNVSSEEYSTIIDLIRNKPSAPEGFDYRLKADLTWELYELPPMPPEYDEEATAEDYEAALGRFGV